MRSCRRFVWTGLVVLAGIALPAIARAIAVDGVLDAAYTLLSTQAVQTPAPDAIQGLVDFSAGSELDAAYAAIENGVLYLFLAGNLKDTIRGSEAGTDFDVLEVFIDSQGGGQHTLLAPSPAGFPLAGLTFDAGFAPDFQFELLPTGALSNSFSLWAYYAQTPSGGGGTTYSLGSTTNAGAPGTLSGGTNPFGVRATLDNRNVAGVGAGCGAASGAGVTAGVELAIPLAAIGNPANCIGVSAFVYSYSGQQVTNQVLAPVPAGTCALGTPAGVDFGNIVGAQFFSVCFGPTPVRARSWAALKSIYR